MKKNLLWMLGAAVLLTLCGCESIKEAWNEAMDPDTEFTENPNHPDFKPKYVLHLNTIVKYPRAGMLERQIPTSDGGTIWINTNQVFSSKNIRDARVVARPGNPDLYDLQFKVDNHGKLQWQILTGNYIAEPLAVVVDGKYITSFYPQPPGSEKDNWVTMKIGINRVTANGIANHAKKNYEYYNPDVNNWFK